MGRAAARRNAPKQLRAIKVGPNKGAKKIGVFVPGVYLMFLYQYRGFIRDNSSVCYGNIRKNPGIFGGKIDKPPVSPKT